MLLISNQLERRRSLKKATIDLKRDDESKRQRLSFHGVLQRRYQIGKLKVSKAVGRYFDEKEAVRDWNCDSCLKVCLSGYKVPSFIFSISFSAFAIYELVISQKMHTFYCIQAFHDKDSWGTGL